MPPPGTAELCLDVTDGRGTTLLIAPVIKTGDGADAVPLRFIGTEGHGVIYADRAQAPHGELARFRLARLAHPVPAQLQHLALADERLVVPEAGQAAFLSRYYPRLRRQATVTSSDGSFTAPEISGPELVVQRRLRRRPPRRRPLGVGVPGRRHRAAGRARRRPRPVPRPGAEARVLAGLSLPASAPGVPREATDRVVSPRSSRGDRPGGWGAGAPQCGGRPGRHAPADTLRGLDAMAFSTEVLPLLRAATTCAWR